MPSISTQACVSTGPRRRARFTSLFAILILLVALSTFAPSPSIAQKDLGPVWVCFDENDPPTDEVLENVQRSIFESIEKYNLTGRWPGSQGDPVALTWSLIPDGVMIPQSNNFDEPQQGALASNLFATMDGQFPSRAAWVSRIQQCFDRWQALTGITFTRVTSGGNAWDDGAAWGTAGDGVNRGDIRISGRCIDGTGGVDCTGGTPTPGNILAYNQFPGNGGDMVIDTSENWFGGGTETFLRNTVTHELGHGLGLRHVCPTTQTKLMEPIITLLFDGPQHDDIRALHDHYGDPFEGDDSSGNATNLGALTAPSPINLGDFPAPAVNFGAIHSIDADGESDWFQFTITEPEALDLTLNPIGLNYDSSTQNMDGTCNSGSFVNSLSIADLDVEVIDTDGNTVLTTANAGGAGGSESLSDFPLPAAGTYFLRVLESNSPGQSQLYGLSLNVNEPPVAQCQDINLDADADCCTSIEVADVDAGSFDPNGVDDVDTICITAVDGNPVSCAQSIEICGPGVHEVELTITDLFGASSSCTAQVTLVDVTPPMVMCPADISVECSVAGGVPADDPQLADFLAGFSAMDNCDPEPVVMNDAPVLFDGPCSNSGGVTVVTWTATDASGNMAECSATVTVIDTTAPTFDTLTVDREVLWPPNHKMVDITVDVEVADVCDDDPQVVLDSVTSSEPDNGQGDGNTVNDIQGVQEGTDDREFSLRSERSGRNRDGRTYTITYSVTDCAGNSTTESIEVRAPHNQSAMAMGMTGFSADGSSLDPAARHVEVVIPSVPVAVAISPDVKTDLPHMLELDASQVPVDRALIGNTSGVARPVSSRIQDASADGIPDLILVFVAEELNALAETTLEHGFVGLQFRTASDGVDRIVKDVFRMGPPLEAPLYQPEEPVLLTGKRPLSIAPNPFNPRTTFSFGLDAPEHVRLVVYNIRGEMIRTLVDGRLTAGGHEYRWDGRDEGGASVASGFYLVRFEIGPEVQTAKVTLLK